MTLKSSSSHVDVCILKREEEEEEETSAACFLSLRCFTFIIRGIHYITMNSKMEGRMKFLRDFKTRLE